VERHAALLFADEASFRQDPSFYQTWARRGHQPLIPTTGQRNTQKVFGAIDLYRLRFYYGRGDVFEGRSYTAFLDGLAQRYGRQEVGLIKEVATVRSMDVVLPVKEHLVLTCNDIRYIV
jgi:hypothetical protein